MREIIDEQMSNTTINTQELLFTYLKKWWIIVLSFVLGAAIALLGALNFITPTYQAKISVYVNNKRGLDDLTYLSSADLNASQSLVNTYMNIAKSDRVLTKIAEKLGGNYTPEGLSAIIATHRLNGTEIFYIYAVHEDPEEAQRIANAAMEIAPAEISNLIEGSSARVIDSAKVPTSRHSPSYTNAAFIGGAAGALLAIIIITVFFLGDTRIKNENDLTDMFSIPILGRIPDFDYSLSESSYSYGENEDKSDKKDDSKSKSNV